MESTLYRSVHTGDSFVSVPQPHSYDPYPTNIEFIMKDKSTKSIKRTGKHLGTGGQGCVYLGVDDEGKEYAIKITDLTNCPSEEKPQKQQDYNRELDLLLKVESPYVARLFGYAAHPDPDIHQHYLLLEYCNCDLQKLIN